MKTSAPVSTRGGAGRSVPRWIALGAVAAYLLLAVALPPAAGEGRYKLKLILTPEDGRRAFTYEQILTRREYGDYEFDKSSFLREALLEATKALAIKKGYLPDIYGEDHYKIVRVSGWEYKLKDLRTDRTIDEGRKR